MYCSPEELRGLIRTAQETGVVSGELALMVRRIAHGIWSRFHRWQDQDDYCHEVVIRFLRYYRRCDVSRPPGEVFSWVTSIATSFGMQQDRADASRRRALVRYFVHLGDDCPSE